MHLLAAVYDHNDDDEDEDGDNANIITSQQSEEELHADIFAAVHDYDNDEEYEDGDDSHTSYLSQTPQTCLCKNFLSGVNFSRLSGKNAYI